MNPFANWKYSDVEGHNDRVRMKTARQHNAEQGVGEYEFRPSPPPAPPAPPAMRIRQSATPLMNKLETEFFNRLYTQYPNYARPRAQAVKLRLCNGVTYSPDIFALDWPKEGGPSGATAWEIKGKHIWEDAIVKIKVAAHEWPEIVFWLCWKEGAIWHMQHVKP